VSRQISSALQSLIATPFVAVFLAAFPSLSLHQKLFVRARRTIVKHFSLVLFSSARVVDGGSGGKAEEPEANGGGVAGG
jgi:hypothetical protein